MRSSFSVAAFVCFPALASGFSSHGLIGYGTDLYEPACAYACQNSISTSLNCTTESADSKVSGRSTHSAAQDAPSNSSWIITNNPTDKCRAHNSFYRDTLAYCIQQHCLDESRSDLEHFWRKHGPGSAGVRTASYRRTIANLTTQPPPQRSVSSNKTLDYFGYVPIRMLKPEYRSLKTYIAIEVTHQRFGLIVFLTCALLPIGLSLLRFLPWNPTFVARLRGYVIDPPLVGSKQADPVGGWFMVPTRGQALFLTYIWGINILLLCIGYQCNSDKGTCFSSDPLNPRSELTSVGNRFGVLGLANFPLVILFAGRNNMLLWVTNWSRTTFLLLHRWVAFISVFEAVVHTFIFLYLFTSKLSREALSELMGKPYWIWGSIATISLSLLILASVQPFRRRFYEPFVVIHILLTILVLMGSYGHIIARYGHARGHETWVYIAVSFWVFDRVMRMARYTCRGVRSAYISNVDEDYMRVDIPGVNARGHVYLHFLSISKWRIWESHPFSVGSVTTWSNNTSPSTHLDKESLQVQTISFSNPFQASAPRWSPQQASRRKSTTACRQPSVAGLAPSSWQKGPGITLLVRRQKGLTSLLKEPSGPFAGLPVLVEGSYNEGMTFLQDNHVRPTQDFPNMACIAGGVGITGVLPFLDKFDGIIRAYGTKKLYWVVRSMPLVHAVEDMLGCHEESDSTERQWGDIDVTLSVGARPNLMLTLQEILKGQRGGVVVVVCGPASMADDVRCCVSKISRRGGFDQSKVLVKLIVECFAW
ncbi:hypothetical protein QQS21_000022 [Conoideocrella luteorostrata]|uniref:Ferric oxidoreductase domain-containing protein n=1 Tax=Conoideocrella luteorostrata TaxID=1105319 RepID=A0AAJ0D207_9HYPO|nr:hypothetical protein QQS21_000022 [Conoideocrella luteorostrata]